jgi:ubiquinone/menaquinone biosynthesis C-methylase UbiE
MFQVKEEIALLKDAKLSADEFEWKVNVADEKKYDEIRRQYDSYLADDQKEATERMTQRLIDLVVTSCKQSDNIVLDIASGMGRLILPLAQKSAENSLIIGTDVDEKPLRGAMNRAKKAETWHKLSLIVTDAKHLSFKDSSLSTISSFFGFDNVPETTLALKEGARVLRTDGHMFLYSLWLREGSDNMRLAEKHRVCQIASEDRLKRTLGNVGLILEEVQEVYSAVWPHNPMDLLPVEGDEYSHVIVRVGKQKG